MLTIVVGAQFGSEGKGLTVGHIAKDYQVHVRVGAANAGHTVYVNGEKHVLQQLPCAAYANPTAKLVLGAGAMISPEILSKEIQRNILWRFERNHPPLQVWIDRRAHVILPQHIETEQRSGLAERIGSTSTVAREGIGAAQAARVMRTDYQQMGNGLALETGYTATKAIHMCDTVRLLHDAMVLGTNILIEGTQGTGLDNVVGYNYPYVTSRHVTASGILADCGLGPSCVDKVIIVARTFPIRVAGPSGPFWPDSKEITWASIGVDEKQERTTVTKKVRRVATFSMDQITYATRVNSATEIALNFCDYLAPEIENRSGSIAKHEAIDYVGPLVQRIQNATLVPVTMLGTGPQTVLERQLSA